MNREAIYSALFALFGDIPKVQNLSRRLKHWDDVTEFPAVFQTQITEFAEKSGRGVPTRWTFLCEIYLYVKTIDSSKAPSPDLNEMVDEIINVMRAPYPVNNKQTLGGLVEDCWIDGQIVTDEGTLGDIAVAIIPIHIIVAEI